MKENSQTQAELTTCLKSGRRDQRKRIMQLASDQGRRLPSSLLRNSSITRWAVSTSFTDKPSASLLTLGACKRIAASNVRFPLSVRATSFARR